MRTRMNNVRCQREIGQWLGVLLLAATCGCYSVDSRGRKVTVRDGLPRGNPKGYAEFFLSENTHVESIGVCRVGDELDLMFVNRLAFVDGQSTRSRVAAPPGLQNFVIECGSRFQISVPISEGMITPVQLDFGEVMDWAGGTRPVRWTVLSPAPYTPVR